MIDILNGKTVPLDKAQISWTGGGGEADQRIHSRQFCLFCLFYRMLQYCRRSQSGMSQRQWATEFWLLFWGSACLSTHTQGYKAMAFIARVLKSGGSTWLSKVNICSSWFSPSKRKWIVLTLWSPYATQRQMVQASCSCSDSIQISLSQNDVSAAQAIFKFIHLKFLFIHLL